MNLKIYSDTNCTEEIEEDILFEGIEYTLDLSTYSIQDCKKWIAHERIQKYISYIPKNSLAQIKFINVVGYVNLFGRMFDVRSSKLLDDLEGHQQFKALVDDITQISAQLSYEYSGTTTIKRNLDKSSFNTNDLEQFDYFYQLTFNFDSSKNLSSLLNQILKSPNRTTESYTDTVPIYKSKKISRNYFKHIARSSSYYKIKETHRLSNKTFLKKIKEKTGKNYIPTHIENIKKQESYNTIENQFVKFTLKEIEAICLRLKQATKDDILLEKINALLQQIHFHLRHPLFKQISSLYYIPDSSSVLLNKAGYRELYYHFVQSKFGFNSLVEELNQNTFKVGLKDIATLYEIWAFFKIGLLVLSDTLIKQTFTNKTINNGAIVKGIVWEGSDLKLGYNISYSRSSRDSYSLTLRPDISFEIDGQLFLFDAKYKFNQRLTNSNTKDIDRYIKSEDIHKMHTYLDAIHNSKCVIALYPGNTFTFYNKEDFTISSDPEDISFSGVGAIPLSPNTETNILEKFIQSLRKHLEKS